MTDISLLTLTYRHSSQTATLAQKIHILMTKFMDTLLEHPLTLSLHSFSLSLRAGNNTVNSFTCHCLPGFIPRTGEDRPQGSRNELNCELDINECDVQEGTPPCPANATCINTYGSFRCECDFGFQVCDSCLCMQPV